MKKNEKQKETTLREQCFNEVKSMVEKKIIQNGDYIDLRKLLEKYGEMQEKPVLEKRGVQNRHLKVRLVITFGNQITFFQNSGRMLEKIYTTEKMNRVGLHDPIKY